MPAPLYQQIQDQLNRYAQTRFSPEAVADVLVTVAQNIMKDYPEAARRLMVEADVAHRDDAGLLVNQL